MRYVIFGAGGIGGTIGACLYQGGHDVLLIARGAHYEAINAKGLRFETPDHSAVLDVPVADRPDAVAWRDDDAVVLAMKSQDTVAAVAGLAAVAPPSVRVICAQNGVENERTALRRFEHVYGICVMCPTSFLQPGVVQAYASPVHGLLDIGRYPSGVDAVAEEIASVLSSSSFESEPRTDIMRWKYGKLLLNLANAVAALAGPEAPRADFAKQVPRPSRACTPPASSSSIATRTEPVAQTSLLCGRSVARRAARVRRGRASNGA